jgi:hypothetical protein
MIVPVSTKVKSLVLAACKGTEDMSHRLVRLRQYEWSASDGVWVRVDGEDDEWYIRTNADGALESYPRPRFECPKSTCKKDRVYEHEAFQDTCERASMDDGLLLI